MEENLVELLSVNQCLTNCEVINRLVVTTNYEETCVLVSNLTGGPIPYRICFMV